MMRGPARSPHGCKHSEEEDHLHCLELAMDESYSVETEACLCILVGVYLV